MASIRARPTSLLHLHLTSTTSKPPAPAAAVSLPSRRQCLLFLVATPSLSAHELQARAQDIPLFGLRKRLEKVEQEAEEIVKEGVEAAEKGVVAVEEGVVAAETVVGFGGFAQAAAVTVAELAGVVVATSLVNGILGPENKNL